MAKAKPTIPNDELVKLQEQIAALDQNWKRALADYQNLVKRIESEKVEIMKLASLNIVNKLIPTLDVLELAALHSKDPGVGMAVKQFSQVLAAEGLTEIVPVAGDKFDPSLHECIETVVGEAPDTIAEMLAKGYRLDNFTLRPAKVKVFKLASN